MPDILPENRLQLTFFDGLAIGIGLKIQLIVASLGGRLVDCERINETCVSYRVIYRVFFFPTKLG